MEYPPGATPLDPDEADGLKLAHVTTRGELDYFEAANIRKAEQWAFGRKHRDLLAPDFIRRLHQRMFGDVWKWAGRYRTTEKNIGVLAWNIGAELRQLCDNVRYQIEHHSSSRTNWPRDFITSLSKFIRSLTATDASAGL